MNMFRGIVLSALILCAGNAWGQSTPKTPRIGYLYPSGGQQGTVFQITVGGQNLKGVTDAYLSGEGVRATLVRFLGRFKKLTKEERKELERRLTALREKESLPTTEQVDLPDHPLLNDLENLSPQELDFVEHQLLKGDKKKQPNAQIAETALIEIAIDPDAPPGDRKFRLKTSNGLTNPMCFQVGLLPEIREQEPYDVNAPETPPVDLPVVLNGQIKPGDVDRFRFRARQGQRLVIETKARHLIPYLADAVPGWFQATLALYDAEGNEVAFADDYRFDPDPVLFYKIAETGLYELEIRDSIYRGREDFVYRISLGEQPFIKSVFPLGGRAGAKTVASIDGWNLSRKRLPLDTRPGVDGIREAALQRNGRLSNSVTYAVDTLPEFDETEPNDNAQNAQPMDLPGIVNGRILEPGDVDLFRFDGGAGDEVVAEVYARRLNSPLDSLLRLTDDSGCVVEWNDDNEDRESGLLTHHADSYLLARLPKDGEYRVHLADSQHHGGEEYSYRLYIGPPRPDFALKVTPSSINVPTGRAAPISVHALRKDGFDGDIEVVLKDGPAGFMLNGGRIPGGRDRICVTLTAPRQPFDQPVVLHLEGRARINGKEIRRPIVPSEDMTQAFIYRHLVPSQELLVTVTGSKRGTLLFDRAGKDPVRIPVGGEAQVRIDTPKHSMFEDLQLELIEPPVGVILKDVIVEPRSFAFVLAADTKTVKAGFMDNLIIEAFAKKVAGPKSGKKPKRKKRVSLGVLPAIPIEIVEP